ncbi:MAG TPA: hypothetical protein VKG78_03630 [Opitutaceae bacterium]|nr:hypothetical protein [Opitutaceae bacterium]
MNGGGPAHDRPYFKVLLNLPHAGRIARRMVPLLPDARPPGGPEAAARRLTIELVGLLDPCLDIDENPPGELGAKLRDDAARIGRSLVDEIERGGFGHDRLGQCVRNLFECLELGLEGADLSLRAGEDPRSLQRPY